MSDAIIDEAIASLKPGESTVFQWKPGTSFILPNDCDFASLPGYTNLFTVRRRMPRKKWWWFGYAG